MLFGKCTCSRDAGGTFQSSQVLVELRSWIPLPLNVPKRLAHLP